MSAVQGHVDARFARVREVFEASFAPSAGSERERGASVAVVIDGKLVVDLHGGFMDKAQAQPWTDDTIANVWSVTKAWTSTMALRLVDQGKLDLDRPVASYWPELGRHGKGDLRVRELLAHRAGLPAIRDLLPPEALFDWEAMTSALANETPWWPPGTKHGYHAVTFGWLVGELIRRVSGKSPGTFFRDEIAGPLGIAHHAMMGFGPEEDPRCAELRFSKRDPNGPPTLVDKLMAAPESMAARAFSNPPALVIPHIALSRAWRGAELPAINGHTNARALARFYGALARRGEIDGVRVLSSTLATELAKEHSVGHDAILDVETRFGLGFMLNLPHASFGPNEGCFGHPGMGGSVGCANPEARVGFGYVTNMLGVHILVDPRASRLIDAVYASLA